jgi:hypothetical protein
MINTSHSHQFLHEQEREWFVNIIRSAQFSYYSTLTFNQTVDSHESQKRFDDFIKMSSSRCRDEIAFILAEESGTYSGLSRDYSVRRHLHAVLLSHSDLNAQDVERRWSLLIGNAKVENYDFTKDGIGYVLKLRNQVQCDWRLSDNIFLFQPDDILRDYKPKNKAEKQQLKRHLKRRSEAQAPPAIR